jgi:hypothetical protein
MKVLYLDNECYTLNGGIFKGAPIKKDGPYPEEFFDPQIKVLVVNKTNRLIYFGGCCGTYNIKGERLGQHSNDFSTNEKVVITTFGSPSNRIYLI